MPFSTDQWTRGIGVGRRSAAGAASGDEAAPPAARPMAGLGVGSTNGEGAASASAWLAGVGGAGERRLGSAREVAGVVLLNSQWAFGGFGGGDRSAIDLLKPALQVADVALEVAEAFFQGVDTSCQRFRLAQMPPGKWWPCGNVRGFTGLPSDGGCC